jgi:hypothetical protein
MNEALHKIENAAVDFIAVFAPWLGPIPSAYLVGAACIDYLQWHWTIAIIAALTVESIGVVSVVIALRLFEWNETKNKSDASAPFGLALVNVLFYFVVTIGLTVMLDVFPQLARYAPAVFPLLAAVGAVNIAIKNGQLRREVAKRRAKAERTTKRNATRTQPVKPKAQPTQLEAQPAQAAVVAQLDGTKLEVYKAFRAKPDATHQEIADQVGVSRQMVGRYKKQLNGVLK